MKLSELSLREYLAIEFLPAFMRHYSALGGSEEQVAENTAKYSFVYADAFMRVVGREAELHAHEIETLTRRAEKAEASVALLLNIQEDGKFAVRAALEDIWKFLAVDNQTAAMEQLRQMKGMIEEFGK